MLTLQTRVYAQAAGYPAEGKQLGAPPVFIFEPHQPEQCEFKPQVLLDITPVYEIKEKAMESMEQTPVELLSRPGERRGTQAVRNSGKKESSTPRLTSASIRKWPANSLRDIHMPHVIVRSIPRPDAQAVKVLGELGVATIHEAQGRTGAMHPYLRPSTRRRRASVRPSRCCATRATIS